MGTLRTIAFLFLLTCAVEQNNGVPVPRTTDPAHHLQTELYTETYTEIITDTVLSADIEGAIQERHGGPLESDPVAEPNAHNHREDHDHSINAEDCDHENENDAQGGDDGSRSVSDKDFVNEEGTLLTSKEEDTFINGGNDTHGTPHDGVNSTAEGTESTQYVLSVMPHNNDSVVVSTDSTQDTSSAALQVSRNRVVATPTHGSNQEEFSATPHGLDLTPEISEPSTTFPHLPSRTAAILHHRNDSSPNDESVNDEITPSLEPLVTEIYTEIIEMTEVVMLDTYSKSEETISEQDDEDSEHRAILGEAGIETNSTPHNEFSLTPQELDITPEISEPSIMLLPLTPSTAGVDSTSRHSEPSPTLSNLAPSTAEILHHRTDSAPNEESADEITPSLEPFVTEIYTEIMEMTELVMSDTDSESEETVAEQGDEDSEHRETLGEAGYETDSTPRNEFSLTPQGLDLTPEISEPSITLSHSTPRKAGVEFTPEHSVSSPTLSNLKQSTAGIVHHRTDSAPNEESADEITPSLEPFVTEIYTEIMEMTELVMSDTDSKSDEDISIEDDDNSEKRDIINNKGDEDDYTPDPSSRSTQNVVSSISLYTNPTLPYSSAKLFETADRMVLTPDDRDNPSDNNDIHTSYRSESSFDNSDITSDNSYISPEDSYISPHDSDITSDNIDISSDNSDILSDNSNISPDYSDITPDDSDFTSYDNEIISDDSDITLDNTDITSHDSGFTPDNSDSDSDMTDNFAEDLVTEICTEIMEITELVISDADDSQSGETLLIPNDSDITPDDSDITPDDSDITPDDSDITPDDSNITPDESDISSDSSDITSDNRNITSDNSDISPDNSDISPDDSYISPNDSDITSDSSDISPDNSDISSDATDSTPEDSDSTPEDSDSTSEDSDITPDDSNSTPDNSDITPDDNNITPDESDITPDDCDLLRRQLLRALFCLRCRVRVRDAIGFSLRVVVRVRYRNESRADVRHSIIISASDLPKSNCRQSICRTTRTPDDSDITSNDSDIIPDNSNIMDNSAEPLVTEIYTEIMEITELVISDDDDTQSDETLLTPDHKGLEQMNGVGNTEHDTNYTPRDPTSSTGYQTARTPELSVPIPQTTDSLPDSTSSTLKNLDVTSHGSTVGTVMTPQYTKSSSDEMTASLTAAKSTPDITPEQSDLVLRTAYSPPREVPTVPSPDIANASSILSDRSAGIKITPSSESLVTEIYTEIVEITEISMVDSRDRSYSDFTPQGSRRSTPSVISSIPHNTNSFQDSTSSTPASSSATPLNTSEQGVALNTIDPSSQRVTAAPADTNSTPDGIGVTPEHLYPPSTIPTEPQIIHHKTTSTLNAKLHSTSAPQNNVIGDDSAPSPEPIATEIYTEVIEVTEILMADTETEPDNTFLAPENEESMQGDVISNEEHDTDNTPQVSDTESDDTISAPDDEDSVQGGIISNDAYDTDYTPQVSPGSRDNLTSSTPKVGASATPNFSKSNTAESSLAPVYTDSTPDGPGTTPKDSNLSPTTADSTLNEPANTNYEPSTVKDVPTGGNATPSTEPFVTEIYTETIEITELVTDENKD